jgi:hypothetical protein
MHASMIAHVSYNALHLTSTMAGLQPMLTRCLDERRRLGQVSNARARSTVHYYIRTLSLQRLLALCTPI